LTQSPVNTAAGPIRKDQAYILAIQTGNPPFDKLLYEHTYREFSKLLSVALGTIKTRIRDGLIRMRDCMGVNW